MTTSTGVAESLGDVSPADQAPASHLVAADRPVSQRQARRGADLAVVISLGIVEAAWLGTLAWATWTFVL